MSRGSPRIGRSVITSAEEALHAQSQQGEIGTLKPEVLNPPQHTAAWNTPDGNVMEIEDAPPPWESDPSKRRDDTDARSFVKVPENWVLRWVNPRLLEQVGERDWMPVLVSNPKVTPLVSSMVSPEGHIRRGGMRGDLLYWMPRHWWESRQRIKDERNKRLTQRAVDHQQEVKEALRRGPTGRYVSVMETKHPTHTIGDGRSMTD